MPKKANDNNNKKNQKEKGPLKRQKTLRRKDTIKPKDNINEKENLPVKEPAINNNPYQGNESVVKLIVDKIITISIRKAISDTILKGLDDYYFNYLTSQVNAMFSTNNMFYTDEPESPNIDNSSFWKTDYNKCNTWVEIAEPNSIKCDRFESVFMNHVDLKNKSLFPDSSGRNLPKINDIDNDLNDDLKRKLIKQYSMKRNNKNQNNLDILEEKSSIESIEEGNRSPKRNLTKNKISNLNLKSPNKLNINVNLKSIISETKKSANFNSTNLSLISSNRNKRGKNEIIQLPTKEIPGINDEYNFKKYEPPNVEFLRRELEEQLERKTKEEKKLHNQLKQKIKESQNNSEDKKKEVKKIKYFDSNKLTFDSNGKIMTFKPIKIELFVKDFAILKNNIKSFNKFNKKKIKKRGFDEVSQTTRERENKTNMTNRENVIKNPEDDPNGRHRKEYLKLNLDKNEKITPSGSNFSLMLPNIGVVLKENEQVKRGTREFGKYFNKYSKEDYDKILKDYVPLQNRPMMQGKMGSIIKSPINKFLNNTNTSLNQNGNNSTIMNNNREDFSNPLINSDNETFQNNSLIKTMKMNRNSANNSLLTSRNYNSLYMSKNKNISTGNLEGVIKLNKDGISSLKVEFDSLKDLEHKNLKNFYSPGNTGMRNVNIFGKKYREIFKNLSKEKNDSQHLNEFNKKIITNSEWGNKTMRKNMSSGNVFGKHLTKYQALRELGSNLFSRIKVKLPRDRKINIQI